jgi:IS4 transposase
MVLDAVLCRFIEKSPLTVMAQVLMQKALEPAWIDRLFEEHRKRQYTRELLFSSTVDLMSLVAVGLQPSVHAAAKANKDLPITLTALYNKLNRTETTVMEELIRGSSLRLAEVLDEVGSVKPAIVAGFRLRVLDGNHLPASQKRLGPLRGFRGAALPGQALVVYDPDKGLVVNAVFGEDGHAQERSLMEPILQSAKTGDLWLADRNFCTTAILSGLHRNKAAFVIREHAASPNPEVLGKLKKIGRVETGLVYEQPVQIELADGQIIRLRRVELHLDTPSENGDKVIRLLSNMPKRFSAKKLARLYRRRWSIENMFQRLESVLHSEIRSLGHPKAALFGLAVAMMAYNVLSVVQSVTAKKHGLDDNSDIELSSFFVANEIRIGFAGMLIAVDPSVFEELQNLSIKKIARLLLDIADNVDPHRFRKHLRAPKPKAKKGYVSGGAARKHVATSRVLKNGTV